MSHMIAVCSNVNSFNIVSNVPMTLVIITKLPESGVLRGNVVAEDSLNPQNKGILCHPKQNDIDTQHTRRRLFCVYAMLFI